MILVLGFPWELPTLLGVHGPTAWRMPFELLGLMHGSFFAPLYFLALFSALRKQLVWKPNFQTTDWLYGVECTVCDWATPVCRERHEAYLREEIHTKTTGHQHYELLSAIKTQLEVI